MTPESRTFVEAIERGDLAAVKACPKSDLHNHFFAGGDRAYIRQKTGRDILPLDQPLHAMEDMHAFIGASFGDVFEGPEGRLFAFEATLVQAVNDGVSRLEVGEDVWASTLCGGGAEEITMRMIERHQSVAPGVAWIRQIGLSRHCAIPSLQAWLEPFLAVDLYHSLDLSGDELAQPIEAFIPLYRQAKSAGLKLRAHVGEWGNANDVWRAVEVLELDAVQHGIAAATSTNVMRFLADHKVPLNICPTSNILLARVSDMKVHPIRVLFDAGVAVTINSDDVLVFGQGVSDEYLNLYRAGVFTAPELDQIRRYGLSVDRDELPG